MWRIYSNPDPQGGVAEDVKKIITAQRAGRG
jgi:hypothetical protein